VLDSSFSTEKVSQLKETKNAKKYEPSFCNPMTKKNKEEVINQPSKHLGFLIFLGGRFYLN
jgi:hypothetical protein